MNKAITPLRRLGRPSIPGQQIQEARSYFNGIDQPVLCITGMRAYSMKSDLHPISGKGLVLKRTPFPGLQGISELRSQPFQVQSAHPSSDLLIGRKQQPDLTMPSLRV